MKISVIVTAYNLEKYLPQTLDSLKKQRLKSFEVIIVDDGSTDSTPLIIDSYVKENPSFKKITIEHKGLAASRNEGLKAAKGDYVTFLNGDDLYTGLFLSSMLDAAQKNNADMAVGRMSSFDAFGRHTFSSTGELARRRLTDRFDTDLIWNPSLSNKLFRRSKVNDLGLTLPDCGVAQDAVFSMAFALKCNCIACSHRGYMLYRARGLDKDISSASAQLNDYLTAYEIIRAAAYESFVTAIEQAGTQFDKDELLKLQDDYFDQLYLKELTIIFHRFYRRFWSLSEEDIGLVSDAVKELRSKITVQANKKIARWNRDIFNDGSLILTRKEMAQNPVVCICVCGNLTKEQLETELDYIYRQSFPAFELAVHSDLRKIFPKKWKKYENVRFVNAGTQAHFKDSCLETTGAQYIMFLDRFTYIDLKGISHLYGEISKSPDIDFTASPVSRFYNGKVEEYKSSALAFSARRDVQRSEDFPEFMLDLYLSNKLFRVSHLFGIKFRFSDNKVLDAYRLYVNSNFKKVDSSGIYFSESEDRLLGEIAQEKALVPPECAKYLKKWKRLYNKYIIRRRGAEKLKNRLKVIKRLFISMSDAFFQTTLGSLPVKNKVLFYTIRANGKLLENSKCVYDKLNAKKSLCAHLLPHSIFIKPKIYYQLFTSKVIVTDDYLRYLRFFRLRPEQKVIQIWHAGGAFKRFGLDAPSNLSRLEELKTHSQYSTVAVSSEHCRQFYAHAFGISQDIVKALGVPRTDMLLDEDERRRMREKFFERHPKVGKKIIVFFPTFREKAGKKCPYNPQIDWGELDRSLAEDELFIIHKHPVMTEDFLKGRFYDKIKDYTYEPASMLLCVADVIITDYSSVIFDAALLSLPTVFYCPDFDTYERDFYLRYPEDLPGPVIYGFDELMDTVRRVLSEPPLERIGKFRDNQVGACDGNSTERIIELIEEYLKH